jgi:small subunit ribosomal protein S19e
MSYELTLSSVLLLKSKLNYKKMAVYDIEPGEYNKKLAEALKKIPEFLVPEWMHYVKSSVSRVRPPVEDDFWHKRAASILRQIYIKGVVGVSRLKTKYGGRKKRGMQPEIFKKGSGKIIRVILQQAEKAGLLEKADGKKKGRRLTKQGVRFLEAIK